jgi:hypothetical protein
MITGMKWYLARLVYQVVSGEGNHTPQFDEQLRLIQADELNWAREKALVLGQIGAFTFQNTNKQNVTWKFINVTDIFEIDSIEDGAQLYSMTEEPADVNAYMELTNAKAIRTFELTRDQQMITQ